jgi:beta-phosphoglucomutase
MAPINTILFDMDGTLVDTEPTAADAVNECFREWGASIDHTDATHVVGRTWRVAFRYLFQKYPPPLSTDEAGRYVMRRYRELLERKLTPVPGSVDAVRALAKVYPLGLVSGSEREDILWILRKLGIQPEFRVILGAGDYNGSKPSPDGFLKALAVLGSQATTTLAFEDSVAGIASAKAAGLWVTAVTSTNHFAHDISGADEYVTDLRSVSVDWIKAAARPWNATTAV